VLLWTPVAFGTGAAVYLGLGREPSLLIAWIFGFAGVAIAVAARQVTGRRFVLALTGLAAVACVGFLVAKLHSDAAATPIVPAKLGVTSIEGFVVDVESPSERGPRLLIAPVDIEGLTPSQTPGRVRIVIPEPDGPGATPPPGSAIRVLALLDPPPGPASPGAYDFARDAWFEGVGGVGLALRSPDLVEFAPPPILLRLEMALNALRWSVATHLVENIRRVMGPDDGCAAGLAAAVTTSHQDWLAGDDRDALRGSGLAHMLAIAGLHTAAVSGFAFFAFRLAIAAWPWLALRVSGKKVAAAAALLVVAGYLMLSGAHPPARRAAITASVAFLAILADRRAVSLHSLALAALIVLLVEPEAVIQPGFEMSFCATASLVAMAEIWPRRLSSSGLTWPIAALQKGRDWLVAMVMVSLVAGAATGPFAIQHFNRVANYGVFANLTADFLASAVLMPALALCLAAQAIGLTADQVGPLFWAAPVLRRPWRRDDNVFGAADRLGDLVPWHRLRLPLARKTALDRHTHGGCRGPVAQAAPPAAWISSDGGDAAIVASREVVALKPTTRLYATQTWAQRRDLRLPAQPQAALNALFDCDHSACKPHAFTHPAIAAWWTKREPKPERLADLCKGADILILRAETPLPGTCRGVRVLGRAAFARGGAVEIFPQGAGWRLVWSQPLRGERP